MKTTDINEFKSHTVKIGISRAELSALKALCIASNGDETLLSIIKRAQSAFFQDLRIAAQSHQ